MNNVNKRYVAMPDFLFLNKTPLKYLDALTYATIRSFHNSTTDLCYPSYDKVMERSGMSRGCLAASIKRLELSGLITVEHSKREGQCNRYKFNEIERFERVPYDLFTATDLSIHEKAMLLCLRQFYNHASLTNLSTVNQLAHNLGITYSQLYKPYRSLIKKGYILEVHLTNKCVDKGIKKSFLTKKLNWWTDYAPNKKKKVEYVFIVA